MVDESQRAKDQGRRHSAFGVIIQLTKKHAKCTCRNEFVGNISYSGKHLTQIE